MQVMGAAVITLPLRLLFKLALICIQLFCALWFLYAAYDIRMYPIKDFGMIIHEFDPWFNYRATEYLVEHGLYKSFKWYEYMSWYPIGRPIGITIYPGMQMTAVGIYEVMNSLPSFSYEIPKSPVVQALRRFIGSLKRQGFRQLPGIPKKIEYALMGVSDIC